MGREKIISSPFYYKASRLSEYKNLNNLPENHLKKNLILFSQFLKVFNFIISVK